MVDVNAACTSTPIEISYHEEELVNASIEFISKESWLQEIRHLISALKEVDGVASKLVEDGKEAYDRVRLTLLHARPIHGRRRFMSCTQILHPTPSCEVRPSRFFKVTRSSPASSTPPSYSLRLAATSRRSLPLSLALIAKVSTSGHWSAVFAYNAMPPC